MSQPTRLRHVDGVWILARDLRDQSRLATHRLAQHQIAAHRTWGCSAGLDVRFQEGELTVSPGCAIDRCGRTTVLATTFVTRRVAELPVAVVLRVRGDGPAGDVRLRDPRRVQDLDVLVSTVDAAGAVHRGDGHRHWLRRPGPTRLLQGVVPRGSPIVTESLGTTAVWLARVDLGAHRLPAPPAVVAALAEQPPTHALATFVEIAGLSAAGFAIRVRQVWDAAAPPPGERSRVSPYALSWVAVLHAERPDFTPTEEQR